MTILRTPKYAMRWARAVLIITGALSQVGSGPARAEQLNLPAVKNPVVQKECSACHMLYVPGLLPARSWTAIVGDLANHFGENADVTPDVKMQLTAYLAANGADVGRNNKMMLAGLPAAVTPLRVTDLPWWKRKHERRGRVAPAALAANHAKFKGDCAACHKGAANGRFRQPDDD